MPDAIAASALKPARVPAYPRVKVSPLAARIARQRKLDLAHIKGTGPDGRIVRLDILSFLQRQSAGGEALAADVTIVQAAAAPREATVPKDVVAIPHQILKLSGMRKTIARRLTEAKQQIPHIYLTLDVRLDALMALRSDLNTGLASRKVKLSVNDLLIKAQALALMEVPSCNVRFEQDRLLRFHRADIAVAVSVDGGLVTPIIEKANEKTVSGISLEMAELAARARTGRLQPHEYQGGTATLSNMGMMGIAQFAAVINPPQAMILAVGAADRRAMVNGNGQIEPQRVMTVTGSFDHRAIDGADGARMLGAFKALVENPLALLA